MEVQGFLHSTSHAALAKGSESMFHPLQEGRATHLANLLALLLLHQLAISTDQRRSPFGLGKWEYDLI